MCLLCYVFMLLCVLSSSLFDSNQSATVPSPPVLLSLFFLLFYFHSLVFIPFPLCVFYVCAPPPLYRAGGQLGGPSASTFYTWLIGTPAFHQSSSHHKNLGFPRPTLPDCSISLCAELTLDLVYFSFLVCYLLVFVLSQIQVGGRQRQNRWLFCLCLPHLASLPLPEPPGTSAQFVRLVANC